MSRKMKITLTEEKNGALLVVAAYPSEGYRPRDNYMRIEADENWLHMTTDDYEGAAMINIEALPAIRRALARIAKARKAKP